MRANRATTAATPSPTFTHATTCTVPRSSPLLSSSCTPFYPRSQQQLYHPHSGYAGPHDGGCQASVQHSDDVDASQSHFSSWSHVRDSKFYDQQYYAAEPYEVSWALNGGTVWDGGAWQQWGDPVEYAYAEDDTGDSANLFSDSLSYYAESPTLEQDISLCAASNTTSVPVLLSNKNTQFLNCHVNEGSEADLKTLSSITGSTAMPNVFHSVIVPEQASCASKKLKESSVSSFREWKEKAVSGYGQDPAKGERKEVANAVTGSKLDMNSSSSQVALHMSSGFGSQAGEFKLAADLVENARAQKEGNVLLKASYNLSKEHVASDAIDAKHTISVTSDAMESIDNPNLKSYSLSLATDNNQKDVQSKKSVSHHTSMQSNNDLCQSMASPKPITSQALEEMNDYEGLHQEKTNSYFIHPEDVGLCSNGPHLLVECIHNLSKVLLSNQSKTSINALNASACLVLESTICMLSHRLFQCSAIEANSCQDPNCQQEPKNSNDSTKGFVEPGSLQKTSNQFASMQHIFSFERDEVLQNAPKLSSMGDNQNSNLMNQFRVAQEELRVLRGEVLKLQEELAYERAESNATLSIYKDLWSEAQEALKVSRSEIKEISTELAALKQELTNLKFSGGANKESEIRNDDNRTSFKQVENSNIVTSSSQGVMASDLSRASTEERNNASCGSSKKDSEVLTGYFDLGILSNCSNTGTSFSKFEKAESKHSDQATPAKHSSKSCESSSLNHRTKSFLNHTIAAPRKLENDVAQRLSLLLSRQCLDLNKTCTESCMDWSSGLHTILEPSSNVPKEDETMPPNKNYLVWSEISCLVNDNNESGCSISNLSCQRKHVSEEEEEEEDGLYDLMERDGGMYSAVLNEGVCQEDEIEIICFKPGIADSNFTCLKGEPEWEDVVVTALDDHRSTREELV